MVKPKEEAENPKSDVQPEPSDKCDYCRGEMPKGGGVAAQEGKLVVLCCSWRHLHWRLVDIFTTGKHIDMGMK